MSEQNTAPAIDAAAVAKLTPEQRTSLEQTYTRNGWSKEQVTAALAKPTDPPVSEADKLKAKFSSDTAYKEWQQRQGINPNDKGKVDVLDRAELLPPNDPKEYALQWQGHLTPDLKPEEFVALDNSVRKAFAAGMIPKFSAGAIHQAMLDSAKTVAGIKSDTAKSLFNSEQRVLLERLTGDADKAFASARLVIEKMPQEQVKAWREAGSFDQARVIALLANVGQILSARAAKKSTETK